MDERFCCVIDCDIPAEFSIHGESGMPEDNTDACQAHVGQLLGTPQGAASENNQWTVVYIPCFICHGFEWVCEVHPDKPWSGVAGDKIGCEPDCIGPGMPCRCSPLHNVVVQKENE